MIAKRICFRGIGQCLYILLYASAISHSKSQQTPPYWEVRGRMGGSDAEKQVTHLISPVINRDENQKKAFLGAIVNVFTSKHEKMGSSLKITT